MLEIRVKKGGTAKYRTTSCQQYANILPSRSPTSPRAGGSRVGIEGGVMYSCSMYKAYLSDLRPKGLGGYF